MRVALIAPSLRVEDAFKHKSEHLFQLSGQNTGNFAFVHALFEHCLPHVTLFTWNARPEQVRESADIVLVACANQLGPHSDMGGWANVLERIGLPVVAIGLGAQAPDTVGHVTLTAGTERWLRAMCALSPTAAPNLGLRGEFTLRQLEHFGLEGHAVVTGCPSNFLNLQPDLAAILHAKASANRIERVAVAAGSRHFGHVGPVERTLAKIATQTGGSYIAQAEINMIRLSRGEFSAIDPDELGRINKYVYPELTLGEFQLWCKKHAQCFIDATSWMEALRNYDFVVGARFHGVMLGIQAGTPGGVVAHDSRTAEMCETMMIPFKRWKEIDSQFGVGDLCGIFAFDAEAYQQRRRDLAAAYVGVLRAARIAPAKALVALAVAAAKPIAAPRTN